MSANTNAALANPETTSLAHLSDAELLTQTRSLVGRSNRLLAELLAHLGEVEARGIHRTRACSSLYTYLIYELRFSEDEAFRRVAAARLVRRFPTLLEAIAAGELHLTGLLMLGPHLTVENVSEVMARAKHRTKREIARLVRVLDPLPSVPARIEPLGPAPRRLVPPAPTWEQFVSSLNPVRELEPGERPREWGVEDESQESCLQDERGEGAGPSSTRRESSCPDSSCPDSHPESCLDWSSNGSGNAAGHDTHAPARVDIGAFEEIALPQRFLVQFTAAEEYVRLVQEAKALLSHRAPRVTLEEVQLRAMRAFVEVLRKQKYGSKAPAAATGEHGAGCGAHDAAAGSGHGAPRGAEPELASNRADGYAITVSICDDDGRPRASGKLPPSGIDDPRHDVAGDSAHSVSGQSLAGPPDCSAKPSAPRRRGRYIPAGVRRAVAARDQHRCTYIDASGRRCSETQRLEFHHIVPFAVRRSHEVANLTLRCHAHNALAAEEDFGRELIEARRSSARHGAFSAHGR